jgi:hypothetical protein
MWQFSLMPHANGKFRLIKLSRSKLRMSNKLSTRSLLYTLLHLARLKTSFLTLVYDGKFPHKFWMVLQWQLTMLFTGFFFFGGFSKSASKNWIAFATNNTHVFSIYLEYDLQYFFYHRTSHGSGIGIFRIFDSNEFGHGTTTTTVFQ